MLRTLSLSFGLMLTVGCSPQSPMMGEPTDYDHADTDTDFATDTQDTDDASPDAPPPDETEVYSNPWVTTAKDAVSTFGADVDSASYSYTRRNLTSGAPVEPGYVRVEEFLNYFRFDPPTPDLTDDIPFNVELEAGPSPFGPTEDTKMLRIAVAADQVPEAERDPVNLVFLIDVSGSMNAPDKLGLVKYALKQLVDRLNPTDTLGIVVYASSQGTLLEPTPVTDKSAILDAIDALTAGGSTAGQAGIQAAYDMAQEAYRTDGVNRVVLCSDGDMNVGLTGDALIAEVAARRDEGIFLTTLGVGQGFNDATMEQLANQGDGNYAYLDNEEEALRIVGEALVSTLQVVAKDTKFQVTFDPSVVEQWRLIGYENRVLADDAFDDDTVDGGDIGAGHQVTALYELQLVKGADTGNLATVAIRHKLPTASTSTLAEWSFDASDLQPTFDDLSEPYRFSVGLAEFAEILRGSVHTDATDFTAVRDILDAATATDRTPLENELLYLVDLAEDRPELPRTPTTTP